MSPDSAAFCDSQSSVVCPAYFQGKSRNKVQLGAQEEKTVQERQRERERKRVMLVQV